MKYSEFKPTPLFEVNMSPGNLEKLSKNINALVGIEFELVIPGFSLSENNTVDLVESQINTGTDWKRSLGWFFLGGSRINNPDSVNKLVNTIVNDVTESSNDLWTEELKNPDTYNRVFSLLLDKYLDRINGESDRQRVARARWIADSNDYEWRQAEKEIKQEWIKSTLAGRNFNELFLFFLESKNYRTYWDIYKAYNTIIKWPYYKSATSTELNTVEKIAKSFESAIGKPVTFSKTYHAAERKPGHYAVEPDSTIKGNNKEDGLEFVSPEQSVEAMLKDTDTVKKWALKHGFYTNSSTGMHINVSVPNQQNLDYVKLVMFLGDDYLLKQFGREGNLNCMSALKLITHSSNSNKIDSALREFQNGLNTLASKIIHSGDTSKHISINNKNRWIEFRGPGGNWLYDSDLTNVKNTITRMVVALDIATDPNAYKKEYYKKLYKALSEDNKDNSVKYFVEYTAGNISKDELIMRVRDIQQTRTPI